MQQKYTAIQLYDSKQTRELKMPELFDEYFKIRSKAASKLDF